VTAATGVGPADVAARLLDRVPAASPAGCSPPAGVAVAVQRGASASVAVAGRRTVETPTTTTAPVTIGTHHDLASVTKVVTTSALMALVSNGTVALDDEVRRYLPRFGAGGGGGGGDKDGVTVRDLLGHRAGLWEWQPLYVAMASDRTVSPGPAVAHDLVDRLPLRYRRGVGRHYSDLGFMLLGRIVANVVGGSLSEAIDALVAGPLDLGSLRFSHPAGPDVAMSAFDDRIEMAMIDAGEPYPVPFASADFTGWRTGAIVGEVNDGNAAHAFAGESGHAGLFADIGDLLALGIALAHPGEHDELWQPDVVAEFFAPGPDADQALGFRRAPITLDGRPVTMLGHTGFVGCAMGFVPGTGLAVAMATNRLVTSGAPVPTADLWNEVVTWAAMVASEWRAS